MKTTLKRRSTGFTLIEALITISIASILASIAIPSFNKMIENNRISSASNSFLTALMYSRSEATKRSVSVSICTSSNGSSCNTGLDDYAKGWLVFVDCDEDGSVDIAVQACDLDGDGSNDPDLVLRVQQEFARTSITPTAAAASDSFTYRFTGRPISPVGFRVGVDTTDPKKVINVARTGRVRMEDY